MSDFISLGTPEDLLDVAGNMPAGYPIDAIECAMTRAESVLLLLFGQFDGTGGGRLADHIICDALWTVTGELALLRKLFNHGYRTEGQRVAADLDKALAAARQSTALRQGGAK